LATQTALHRSIFFTSGCKANRPFIPAED
jgi:hypothetical protein